MQFDFPIKMILQDVQVKESAAKDDLSMQKKHAHTLFSKDKADKILTLICAAENHETSYQSAAQKIH